MNQENTQHDIQKRTTRHHHNQLLTLLIHIQSSRAQNHHLQFIQHPQPRTKQPRLSQIHSDRMERRNTISEGTQGPTAPLPIHNREEQPPPSYDTDWMPRPWGPSSSMVNMGLAETETQRARQRKRWRPRTWLGTCGGVFLVLMLVTLVVALALWKKQLPTSPERS